MLSRGSSGIDVKNFQDNLIKLGFMTAKQQATGPGIFGPKTEAALKAFQRSNGITPSGKLTVKTEKLIKKNLSKGVNKIVNVVVDLSHHNGNPNLKKAKADGIVGVIHKATEGFNFVDKKYAQNRSKAEANGILWGAYHFGLKKDGVKQAKHFLKIAKPKKGELLVLDYETNMTLKQARDFVLYIMEETGRFPGLYSGHTIKSALGNKIDPILSQCWFWLAQYGPKAKVPRNWGGYTMWQYTDGKVGPGPHKVDGIGRVDRNRFNGSLSELKNFWRG